MTPTIQEAWAWAAKVDPKPNESDAQAVLRQRSTFAARYPGHYKEASDLAKEVAQSIKECEE